MCKAQAPRIDIDAYTELLHDSIDADGIYPMPTFMIDTDNRLTISAYAPENPSEIILDTRGHVITRNVIEFVFGLDTYTRAGQGTTLCACVIIFHGTRDAVRVGVWEYSHNDGEPITKQVNWENDFWTSRYKSLAENMKQWFEIAEP